MSDEQWKEIIDRLKRYWDGKSKDYIDAQFQQQAKVARVWSDELFIFAKAKSTMKTLLVSVQEKDNEFISGLFKKLKLRPKVLSD